MHSHKILKIFSGILFLIMIALCVVPVSAESGIISITYRGAGGYYIGDGIVFDGKNTVGNITVLRITGPGLPADGVPPYNLTGTPGTGNTAAVDDTNSWTFYWDTSRAAGVDNLYTARYTFTAYDQSNPEIATSTSVMLKKPEFYVSMTPNPATRDDYVVLVGDAEKGASNIEINVLDSQGTKVHTFTSPVGSSGYFNYGFHVDMVPGQYTVIIGSPSMSRSITKTLTVTAAKTNATVSETATESPAVNSTAAPALTPVEGTSGNVATSPSGSLSISSKPAGASVYLDSAYVGKTPLTLNAVSPGSHTVDIRAPGYLSCSIGVTVSEGKATEISPEMVKSPSFLPLSPLTAVFGCIFGAVYLLLVRSHRK